MKAEIILTLVWSSVCLSVRQQRSTVLTDESKRVVEHFDFSNFDRQEALNYIDRQRFENQIRGKRSHTKFKRDHKGVNQNIQTDPESIQTNQLRKAEESNLELNSDLKSQVYDNYLSEPPSCAYENPLHKSIKSLRNRRGHRVKKKRKYRADNFEESEPDYENENENENEENIVEEKHHRKKKKAKKKKKKKKKKRHYWDKWSAWSPCSVTCGRGRRIRWRKCIVKNCTTGELEMGEKTCQLPACNLLTKLLGLGGH